MKAIPIIPGPKIYITHESTLLRKCTNHLPTAGQNSFFHSLPRTEHLLVTVPAAMSFGIDASTGKCDYEGNVSPISLYNLVDVPRQDAREASSFSHLSPLRS